MSKGILRVLAGVVTGLVAVSVSAVVLTLPPAQAAAGDVDADAVLGQPGFTNTSVPCTQPPTAATLCNPAGVAVDPTSGKLYVADYDNNRVLRYASAAGFTNGQSAELVIGQADSTSFNCNRGGSASASSLCNPQAIVVDSAGRLFVADRGNARVLMYTNPGSGTADKAFGQANVTSSGCPGGAPTSSSLCFQTGNSGLAVDASGNLFVTDGGRVLMFSSAATGDTVADKVFGQSSFTTNNCNRSVNHPNTTRQMLCNATGVAVDAAGNLWVADAGNARVLMYANAAGGDTDADLVFGQVAFGARVCNRSQSAPDQTRLCFPWGLAVNAAGTLYVADQSNHRVISFTAAAGGDTTADKIFGQSDYVSKECNKGQDTTNQSRLCGPFGVAVDGAGNLYVADAYNQRVFRYDNP